jgi:hypothetical protein
MPLELDATDVAQTEQPDQSEDWSEIEPKPEAVADAEPQQQLAEVGPSVFREVQEIRDKIALLRVQRSNTQQKLDGIRSQMEPLFKELGDLVADHPDLLRPAPILKIETDKPVDVMVHDWRDDPVTKLNLTTTVKGFLLKEMETCGELNDYIEVEGTLEELDGITAKRDERIKKALIEYVESWK